MAHPPKQATRVLELLAAQDRSVSWLARQIGRSRQSVGEWLDGVSEPTDAQVWERMEEALAPRLVPVSGARMVRLPILGGASAGDGLTHGDADEQGFEVPVTFSYTDYAAWFVDGDSMMPQLHPGDVAIFREWPQPKVGAVCAIRADGSVMVKRVAFRDGLWLLESFNPAYESMPLPRDHQMLGYLVGLYRTEYGEESWRHNRAGLRFD